MSTYMFSAAATLQYRRADGPLEELLVAAKAYAEARNTALTFVYEGVLVRLNAQTDLGLLERDWLLAYYGATDWGMIGPHPTPEINTLYEHCYRVIESSCHAANTVTRATRQRVRIVRDTPELEEEIDQLVLVLV